MGIWLSRQSLVDTLIELAGFKAGVVVTEADVVAMVADTTIGASFLSSGKGGGRIRSEELDEAAAQLLYALGNIPYPSTVGNTIELYHKYRADPKALEVYQGVQRLYLKIIPRIMAAAKPGTLLDPSEFMRAVHRRFGNAGLDMAMEIVTGVNADLHRSPWGNIRIVDWKDETELRSLFEEEKLETLHGRFFDQRYIDFLHRNFDRIDEIHWRKFEGLTAEYFEREGFQVQMGPGRGDEGVDIRIYPTDAIKDAPPLILVQCKRQKAKISLDLVKSVYADVAWEKAQSGLIVTTSSLSPGAERIRTARAYDVETADRTRLREWIDKMRSGA